jgi:hypothetical protein
MSCHRSHANPSNTARDQIELAIQIQFMADNLANVIDESRSVLQNLQPPTLITRSSNRVITEIPAIDAVGHTFRAWHRLAKLLHRDR